MAKSRKTKRRKHRDANYSHLEQHTRRGKTLIPPLNRVENFNKSSWRDDHAPEMLWALLLSASLPRDHYLACFRQAVKWFRATFPPADEPEARSPTPVASDDSGIATACELDHTSLSELTNEQFEAFARIPLAHNLGYAALRPLLLIDALPGIDRWRSVLAVEPTDADWDTLGAAVVAALDHQSEQSTDVRWLKYVLKMALGKMRFPSSLRERAEEILFFPNRGDLRVVRPSIRAGEMMLRRNPPSPWIDEFWNEVQLKTKCIDGSGEEDYFKVAVTTLERGAILQARHDLAEGFIAATNTTRADARLDSAFGFVFYALSLLEEIAAPPNSQLLVGRIGLRAIAEVVITFSYLVRHDSTEHWMAYRNFGSGQAKLAFLKLEQQSGDLPTFVHLDTLFEIANEDVWQEFLNIDFGHWANKNLRDLALEGGTKELYDNYYGWASGFTHGHWNAVRDSNFTTCHNPLHRLHRIPRPYHRLMPSVVDDAVKLVDMAYELLEKCFPALGALSRVGPASRQGQADQAPTQEP